MHFKKHMHAKLTATAKACMKESKHAYELLNIGTYLYKAPSPPPPTESSKPRSPTKAHLHEEKGPASDRLSRHTHDSRNRHTKQGKQRQTKYALGSGVQMPTAKACTRISELSDCVQDSCASSQCSCFREKCMHASARPG